MFDPDVPTLSAFTLGDGRYVEIDVVSGAEEFAATEPYPVRVVPVRLVRTDGTADGAHHRGAVGASMSPAGPERLSLVSTERAAWEGRPDAELVVVEVLGPLRVGEARVLAEAVTHRLRSVRAGVLVCDVLPGADLGVLDVVTRLALAARQLGVPMRLRSSDQGLAALLALTGLDGLGQLPPVERLEPVGQPKTR